MIRNYIYIEVNVKLQSKYLCRAGLRCSVIHRCCNFCLLFWILCIKECWPDIKPSVMSIYISNVNDKDTIFIKYTAVENCYCLTLNIHCLLYLSLLYNVQKNDPSVACWNHKMPNIASIIANNCIIILCRLPWW